MCMACPLSMWFVKAQSVIIFLTKSCCHNCMTKNSKMYLFMFCKWHRVVFYVTNHVFIAFRFVIRLNSGWLCVCMHACVRACMPVHECVCVRAYMRALCLCVGTSMDITD